MDRDAFLARLRSRPATAVATELPASLPLTNASGDGRTLDRFIDELEAVGGRGLVVGAADLAEAVAEAVAGCGSAVVGPDLGTFETAVRGGLAAAGCEQRPPDRAAAAAADVGVTGAVLAVASTGSVLLSSAAGPRTTSLLPPVHLVVVGEDAIVEGFEELISALPSLARDASQLVLVTGPSRTGDIEMTLVYGVHGPERLVALVVRS